MTVSDPGAGQQQGREPYVGDAAQIVNALAAWTEPAPEQVSEHDALVLLSTLYGRGHGWNEPGQTRQQLTEANVALVREFVANHPASSPTPPARDSGRDEARERDTQLDTSVPFGEAREAVARWLARRDASPGAWDAQVKAGPVGERWCDRRRHDADELLALPELDKLLRRPA